MDGYSHRRRPATPIGIPTPPGTLTESQQLVLNHLRDGHTQRQVAKLLAISPGTVTDHLKRVRDRFEVDSTDELLAVLTELGLLATPSD